MKKILISILILLLGTTVYMIMFNNIEIGEWKTTNIEELQNLNEELNDNIEQARALNEQEYINKIEELNQSIKALKTSKETYENKIKSINQDAELGVVQVKEYKIEYLWTILENYAKDEQVLLKLDLVENGGENLYNIDITLKGDYIGITDFIYDIEKDDTFDFKIEEFKISPATVVNSQIKTDGTSQNNQQIVVDASTLQATFTIKNLRIELD